VTSRLGTGKSLTPFYSVRWLSHSVNVHTYSVTVRIKLNEISAILQERVMYVEYVV
jgi:hypothetical protein